jgi:hypothetical protein
MILANYGIIASSGAVIIPSTLSNNLISYYKAESNTNDSLNVNNGTAQGGLTYSSGKSGNAFTLNGTNAYVEIGDKMDIGYDSWTYSSWVNPSSLTSGNYFSIFGKFQAANVVGRIWANFYGDKLQFGWQAFNVIQLETLSTFSTNTWYHLTFVIDRANNMRIYINGVLASVNVISGVNDLIPYAIYTYDNNFPFRLGAITSGDNVTPVAFFNGLIDELGIWNRALSQSEITELQTKYYPF